MAPQPSTSASSDHGGVAGEYALAWQPRGVVPTHASYESAERLLPALKPAHDPRSCDGWLMYPLATCTAGSSDTAPPLGLLTWVTAADQLVLHCVVGLQERIANCVALR